MPSLGLQYTYRVLLCLFSGKNRLYSTLVEDVRNAFKLDDLVRIDCQGLKPTDYKKIGAKLKVSSHYSM